ncbi:hypothetical protein SUGI_0270830 [Cryptomeria japonica]|nr:hypothetical protein SUGI_0270830 [Cryptomeria japonica]
MASEANRTTLGVRKPSSFNLVSFTRTREEIFPKHGPPNFQKPPVFNTDNIMIISNNHTDELWDCYNARGLFGKWFGFGVPSSEIQQWLKFLTGNQISIMNLENDFLFINCNTADLKENLLKNNQRFFRGYCFKFFNWKPNFSPKDVKKIRVPKWIRFPNMPVELIHKEILKKLGEFLGGFEGLEDNYLESSDIKILANIEIGKSTFVPIKIIPNHSIYEIKPEITANDFIPKTCFSSDHGSKITCIKASRGEVLDIKFNHKGGFMLNRQNLGSKVSNNTLRLSESKGKETLLKDPIVELRRRDPVNKQSLSPIPLPIANKIINDLNIADKTKGPLILETTPSHQESLSAQIMNTLEENDSLSDQTLNLENRDKNKKKKEKKKKKNKKRKGRNKK